MGLLRAQGAYFSINDNSHEMYMVLPGSDMKLPIKVADDNTFVMRLKVLPTPGTQPVPVVPSRPEEKEAVVSIYPPQVGMPHPKLNCPHVSETSRHVVELKKRDALECAPKKMSESFETD